MGELMRDILAAKLKDRKRLAELPIEEKLALMEQMRDRGLLISENPLRVQRQPIMPVVVVSGDAVALWVQGAQIGALTPPAFHQSQDQPNTPQIVETLFAELRKQPERWHVARLQETEPEFVFRPLA